MKNSILQYLFALMFLMSLLSCSTQNMLGSASKIAVNTSAFNQDANTEYRIRKDDKISMSIWDHDDMSVGSLFGIYNSNEVYGKWVLVDAEGNITLPKIATVHVLGLTVLETEKMLVKEYSKWIVNPVIKIKVLNKEVTILGEIKTPGNYLLEKENNTLIELLAKSGDFDFYADRKRIQVIRKVNGVPASIVLDLTKADAMFSQNIKIQPGDIVYVPSRKGKVWDKRSGSIIVPLATIISSAVLVNNLVK